MVNEALLTGESKEVEKNVGQNVYAGTMNQYGALRIVVTKGESETALSQIIRIVEDAQSSKAPIQQIADKVTGIFVPVIIGISLLTFALCFFMLHPGEVGTALERTIAVLIIACPCALGLATPTSVMVGSGRAAQEGILFKEGKYLEELGKGTVVVLDKTGTLTKGTPVVTDINVEDVSEQKLLELIGAVESVTDHPVAKAIIMKCKEKGIPITNPSHAETIPGYGMKAFVNGKSVLICSPSYFLQQGILLPLTAKKELIRLENEGKTIMLAAVNSRYAGMIAVEDEVKPSSKAAIKSLTDMDLKVMMLTGDHLKTALSIADKTGIKHVVAAATPQKKAEIIRELKSQGHNVVMVGDGINDAPALTLADVGIAIGTGSDIAIESGDVTVIKGDIAKVVEAIKISKATLTNIKQNFIWAFSYNLCCIPFAIFGLLAPWLAGAVMAFSSVSVVLNALRLQKQ